MIEFPEAWVQPCRAADVKGEKCGSGAECHGNFPRRLHGRQS